MRVIFILLKVIVATAIIGILNYALATIVYTKENSCTCYGISISERCIGYKKPCEPCGTLDTTTNLDEVSLETPTAVQINFSECSPQTKRIDTAFGSTTYKIVGITSTEQGQKCEMHFGNNIENSNVENLAQNVCIIPTSYNVMQFEVTAYGINFSEIKSYCRSLQ